MSCLLHLQIFKAHKRVRASSPPSPWLARDTSRASFPPSAHSTSWFSVASRGRRSESARNARPRGTRESYKYFARELTASFAGLECAALLRKMQHQQRR